MIAYNRQSLDNLSIQQEAQAAYNKGIISNTEQQRIGEAYPNPLYMPHFWARVGLFLLTLLICVCALALFLLGALNDEKALSILLLLFGSLAYFALELFIYNRGVYRAGIDDALLWIGGGLIFAGIDTLVYRLNPAAQSLIILLLALVSVLRYADRLMAMVAYGALLNMIFQVVMEGGATGRAVLPFLIMGVSILFYFLSTRLADMQRMRHYRAALVSLRVLTLLSFYLAGNYFVIRQLSEQITYSPAPPAFGWLWWILTVAMPVFYIVRGIQKKDVVFLWTGLLLVAAAIFTVRYYYHVLPTEIAMIAGGGILIAGAFWVIRYLHTPRHGFTSAAPDYPHVLEHLPVEGLILAESLKNAAASPTGPDARFGGGSGGGGGAGGTF